MADRALRLYKAETPTPVGQTWVSLFTTNPTTDTPTSNGAVEWGPPRIRVFPNAGAGTPSWSEPQDSDDPLVREIVNVGSVQWATITLTVSPNSVIGVGVYDAATAGNLLTWAAITPLVPVADGESHVFGTGQLSIEGD